MKLTVFPDKCLIEVTPDLNDRRTFLMIDPDYDTITYNDYMGIISKENLISKLKFNNEIVDVVSVKREKDMVTFLDANTLKWHTKKFEEEISEISEDIKRMLIAPNGSKVSYITRSIGWEMISNITLDEDDMQASISVSCLLNFPRWFPEFGNDNSIFLVHRTSSNQRSTPSPRKLSYASPSKKLEVGESDFFFDLPGKYELLTSILPMMSMKTVYEKVYSLSLSDLETSIEDGRLMIAAAINYPYDSPRSVYNIRKDNYVNTITKEYVQKDESTLFPISNSLKAVYTLTVTRVNDNLAKINIVISNKEKGIEFLIFSFFGGGNKYEFSVPPSQVIRQNEFRWSLSMMEKTGEIDIDVKIL